MNIKSSLFSRDTYWTITVDGDCSHVIKRCFLLGWNAMTKLGSTLKNRDITLLIKVLIFKLLVTQPCLTLWDPMVCGLSASSAHGILQARILEWVAIPFCRGSSWPRDWTWVFCIVDRFLTVWATLISSVMGRYCCED